MCESRGEWGLHLSSLGVSTISTLSDECPLPKSPDTPEVERELGDLLKTAPPSEEGVRLKGDLELEFELFEPDRSRLLTPGTSNEALEAALCIILRPFEGLGLVPNPFDPTSAPPSLVLTRLAVESARVLFCSSPISRLGAPPLVSLRFMRSSNQPPIRS